AKGTTLNISVDGMFTEEGPLDWWLRLRPSNDNLDEARRIHEPFYETIASHRGASAEPFEVTLHPADSVSVWWAWRAPASAPTKVHTFAPEALTQLRAYTGSAAKLTPVGSAGGEWNLNNSLTFDAVAGQTYLIAVLGQNGQMTDFKLQINQDLLRLGSPLDGSVYQAHSTLKF